MSDRRAAAARVVAAGAGAVMARAMLAALRRSSSPGWTRTNYRGAPVSLAGGPALATAAALSAAAAAPSRPAAAASLVAGLGAGGVGLYDDLVGQRPDQQAKGFVGHLAALRRGRVTSGVVKIVGVGVVGLAASTLLQAGHRRSSHWRAAGNVSLGAAVVAGAANLANLLDLRPGRALKVGLLLGVPLSSGRAGGLAAGPVGACAGLLPDDLAERTMLGDSGANALGALLGVALAARTGPAGRAAAAAAIVALTAASERVSFTRVIAHTPVLRELDHLGRQPDPCDGG